MKNTVSNILSSYLKVYPEERVRQSIFKKYIETHNGKEIIDWNNFNGHIVTGGFIYALKEKKFLVLHHKDLDMYLYPGGHVETTDNNPLDACIREVHEETGLENLIQLTIINDNLIPIDIDTHKVPYNKRLNLPVHYHFDFRYLFVIDKIEKITIDTEEASDYKWIDIKDLYNDSNYGKVSLKIEQIFTKGK